MSLRAGLKTSIPALRSPALWAWLAFSALPPELLCHAFGWTMVDPAYLVLSLLWWPMDTFGRLAALRMLVVAQPKKNGDAAPERPWRPALAAWPSALASEILASLKAGNLALAGLIPALAFLSLLTPDQMAQWGYRGAFLAMVALGLAPAGVYLLRRLLAPLELLRRRLGAGEALEASAQRLDGKLGAFLRIALPWLALNWVLDAAGLALPDWVAWGLALPSLAATLMPIALSQDL